MRIIYLSHVPIDSSYGAGTSFRNHLILLNKFKSINHYPIIFYRISISQIFKYIFESIKFYLHENMIAITEERGVLTS